MFVVSFRFVWFDCFVFSLAYSTLFAVIVMYVPRACFDRSESTFIRLQQQYATYILTPLQDLLAGQMFCCNCYCNCCYKFESSLLYALFVSHSIVEWWWCKEVIAGFSLIVFTLFTVILCCNRRAQDSQAGMPDPMGCTSFNLTPTTSI